jgi:2'-5' RNA ligase
MKQEIELQRPDLWRTFVAIALPPPLTRKLADLRHKLPVGPARSVRWIPPDGIHLTLRFLGDIEPTRVSGVVERLKAAASQSGRFSLEPSSPGAFPPSGPPRIFWVGLAGELQRLNLLQGRIEGGLSTIGFEPDRRPFHPHLTVGRISTMARSREAMDARSAYSRLEIEPGQRFEVQSVTFFRSHLLEDGARYEVLATAELA